MNNPHSSPYLINTFSCILSLIGRFYFFLLIIAVVQGKKLLKDGKEYTYNSEIRVGTGTMDYAPHLAGTVYRMKTRLQTSNNAKTLNLEVGIP